MTARFADPVIGLAAALLVVALGMLTVNAVLQARQRRENERKRRERIAQQMRREEWLAERRSKIAEWHEFERRRGR